MLSFASSLIKTLLDIPNYVSAVVMSQYNISQRVTHFITQFSLTDRKLWTFCDRFFLARQMVRFPSASTAILVAGWTRRVAHGSGLKVNLGSGQVVSPSNGASGYQ